MTSEKITVGKAAELLLSRDNYIILSHANPDGDTAGCAWGLCRALQKIGKKAKVRCCEPFSQRLSFMWEGVTQAEYGENDATTVISVDVADPRLLGPLDHEYRGKIVFSVDHHVSHNDFSDLLLNEPEAAACAQTVYKIIKAMDIPLDKDIAACLYTAISTDSGCFKFSSVTPETHRIAAELLAFDFDFSGINYVMFDMKTRARLDLEQAIYKGLEFYCGGKCAVVTLPKQLLDSVDTEDANGISAMPRQIEGVEVGVVIKEKKNNEWKASLRSNSTVDVQAICKAFGDGGHIRAAGCSFKGVTPEEAKKRLLAEIEKAFV